MSISMALVLTGEQLELYRLSLLSASKSQGLVRAIPYREISDVRIRSRWFEMVVEVIANKGLEISTAKRGGGGETVEELRRRIGA